MSAAAKTSRGRTQADVDYDNGGETKKAKSRSNAKKTSKAKPAPPPVEEDDHHEDHCEACTDGGVLLCCDNCDFAFHFTCAEPPLLPDTQIGDTDQWYCRRCASTRKPQEKNEMTSGPFGPIFELSRSLNPHVFSLPASVRRQSHSERDKTKDAKDLEFVDLVKNPDHCLARYTADEAVVTSRRKGKACFICSMADNPSVMVVCDHCRKVYHRYCLDPSPLSDMDWVCPSSNDAKHRTKGKKVSTRALQTLEKEKAEYEMRRSDYALPFALDFLSGWQPRKTPTDLSSVFAPPRRGGANGHSAWAPSSHTTPASARGPEIPLIMTGGATIPDSRSDATQRALRVANGSAPQGYSGINDDKPLDPQVVLEWSTKIIDLDNALFCEQWYSMSKYLDKSTRVETAKAAKTSAGIAGDSLRKNATIPSIATKIGSSTQALKAASGIVMEVGELRRKCTANELQTNLLPNIDAILESPNSVEFLCFLGYQRLEQIYQYGIQLNSLDVKAKLSSKPNARGNTTATSSSTSFSAANATTAQLARSSANVIELDGGFKAPHGGKAQKKRTGDEATLAPATKRSKQRESTYLSTEVSTVPMALTENDWDAMVDQAIVGAITEGNPSNRANLIHLLQTTSSTPSKFDHLLATPVNGTGHAAASSRRGHSSTPYAASTPSNAGTVSSRVRNRAGSTTTPTATPIASTETRLTELRTSGDSIRAASSSPISSAASLTSLANTAGSGVQSVAGSKPGTTRLVISGSKIRRTATPESITSSNDAAPSTEASNVTVPTQAPATISEPTAPETAEVSSAPTTSAMEVDAPAAPAAADTHTAESLPKKTSRKEADVDMEVDAKSTTDSSHSASVDGHVAPAHAQEETTATTQQLKNAMATNAPEQASTAPAESETQTKPTTVDSTPVPAPLATESKTTTEQTQNQAVEPAETIPSIFHAVDALEKDEISEDTADMLLPLSSTMDTPVKFKSPAKSGSPPLKASPEFWKDLATRTYGEFSKYKQMGVHSILVTLGPERRLRVWTLTQTNSTIGRLSANVSLNDLGGAKISRQHAELKYDAQKRTWTVLVLGRHGVKHNDKSFPAETSFTLSDGDSMTLSQQTHKTGTPLRLDKDFS